MGAKNPLISPIIRPPSQIRGKTEVEEINTSAIRPRSSTINLQAGLASQLTSGLVWRLNKHSKLPVHSDTEAPTLLMNPSSIRKWTKQTEPTQKVPKLRKSHNDHSTFSGYSSHRNDVCTINVRSGWNRDPLSDLIDFSNQKGAFQTKNIESN